MDVKDIKAELEKRFMASFPPFYKRRIIFWYDEDKEFADMAEGLTLDHARVVRLTGKNNFSVKKLLTVDDPDHNFLVYQPFAYENLVDDWLLDVELYSESFRADLVSIWMDELSMADTPGLRQVMKSYRKFFRARPRREKVAAQRKIPQKEADVHLAVMGALAGLSDPTPAGILRKVLASGLTEAENPVFQKLKEFEADRVFWHMASRGTGYAEEPPTLYGLLVHILMTALSTFMPGSFFKGIPVHISSTRQSFCYDFISSWLAGDERETISRYIKDIEDKWNLTSLLGEADMESLMACDLFPGCDRAILLKLMADVGNDLIDTTSIGEAVGRRKSSVWQPQYRAFYEGLLEVAHMWDFGKDHAEGFHEGNAARIWESYTRDYFRMDRFYRLFQRAYAESLTTYDGDLQDLFARVRDKVENLYKNWFLDHLSENWEEAAGEELAAVGHIGGVEQQADFYRFHVQNEKNRVFVIISDALRYEVAVSLSEELRQDHQCQVALSSMEGIFPTITKFGMAALLPHRELSVKISGPNKTERLSVLADQRSTESGSRDAVLKAANRASVALSYKALMQMKREERRAMVKGHEVVYIYHNTIDHLGHADEMAVLPGCDRAVTEIKNLIKMITNEWNGVHVLVTSDHGFLSTYSPLLEDEKLDRLEEDERDVEYGRRYMILKEGTDPDYMMPVRFLSGHTGMEAFATHGTVCLKMRGAGMKFVHGGISLQELVVPLLDYHFLRNQSKEYQDNRYKYDTLPVTLDLLSPPKKISNMIFTLNFYQKEAVGGNRRAAVYTLYFTDSTGELVSDGHHVTADRKSSNIQERRFERIPFNLKSQKYDGKETYYLVIQDEEGKTRRIPFTIDIPFAMDDFDFFA